MNKVWRITDTGLRPPAQNFALNRALLEARQAGEIPSTLRFLRFTPSALLGYHQSAEQELNLDYCAAHGIAIQRRITGGGAIYMDETQLGWELYLTKRDLGSADMTVIARRICEAAARGISALGVEARYRPRNDIEVGGRKISGTGGAFDGEALMYQGTLLVEFDVEKMLRILRIPAEKLSDKAIASARERVVNLKELLGRVPEAAEVRGHIMEAFAGEFGVEFFAGDLTPPELRRYEAALTEIDSPGWVDLVKKPVSDMPILEAAQKFAGGLLRAAVSFDVEAKRVKQVWFTGDIFVNPRRTVNDLESTLKDIALERLESAVREFFAARQVDMLSLTPRDFVTVVNLAIARADRLSAPQGQDTAA
ncbi:MAG: lipoate--protein ligase family protein [Betaproteobacteria bacterium]|nr:lipoate--protein ligase family protein [Betaproteobacteria bacterium]